MVERIASTRSRCFFSCCGVSRHQKVEEKAAKSINEKESRIDINGKTTDNNREAQEVGDLLDLIDDMTRKHEKMKGISIRLAVYDLTEDKLMTRVKKIRDEASQFKSTVMLDELYFEQEALLQVLSLMMNY